MDIVDKTDDQGSTTTMVAAFDLVSTADSVSYLHDCQPFNPASYASDRGIAEMLWHLSKDIVCQRFSLSPQYSLSGNAVWSIYCPR